MRTYLILKERAQRWKADREIQALVAETGAVDAVKFSPAHRDRLLGTPFRSRRPRPQGAGLRKARSAEDGGAARREMTKGLQ
jgi:hypothetical protein